MPLYCSGDFSDADMRTIAGLLPHTIVAGEHGGIARATSVGGDPGIGNREAEMHAIYTGVVPIVYKAQRSLLDSLIQSTLWSFLTITPADDVRVRDRLPLVPSL